MDASVTSTGLSVTVIGGGFAGLMAAWWLADAGFQVTVLEASSDVGGRVWSRLDISEGRVIEAGAELIGVNHPMWISLATEMGLGLSVLTSEDQFDGMGVEGPLFLRGRLLSSGEAADLYRDMGTVFDRITQDSVTIGDPYKPWLSPNASSWDSTTVATMLGRFGVDPKSLLWDALAVELGNNQAVRIEDQSYLGLVSLVRGGALHGDPGAFWTESEVYRCEAGNQQLARRMRDSLNAVNPATVECNAKVRSVTFPGSDVLVGTADGRTFRSQYAVLAVPQPAWSALGISPSVPGSYMISTGPAVKYLSPVKSRFWLLNDQAPAGMSDEIGMTWEGTDNQMVAGSQGIELSVFAGGPWAAAALATDPDRYFRTGLDHMLQGYSSNIAKPATFVAWPRNPLVGCGYSCPTLGQVTGAAKALTSMYQGRVAFAGEHTVMNMFGYMEGALQSGFLAYTRIMEAAGLSRDGG